MSLSWPCGRIRKTWLNGADVAVIGPKLELTYPYQHVGEGAPALGEALSGGADGLLVSCASFRAALHKCPQSLQAAACNTVTEQREHVVASLLRVDTLQFEPAWQRSPSHGMRLTYTGAIEGG